MMRVSAVALVILSIPDKNRVTLILEAYALREEKPCQRMSFSEWPTDAKRQNRWSIHVGIDLS